MRVSYRTAQTLILLGVLLLTVLLVGGSAYYNARFGVQDLATQLLDQGSERVRQYVDDVLQVAIGQGETQRRSFSSPRCVAIPACRISRSVWRTVGTGTCSAVTTGASPSSGSYRMPRAGST